MIRFICGNPGAGKGLYAVRLIVDELVNGKRPIVTNLALDLGRLNEYLQEQHRDVDARVLQRVHILQDDQVSKFFCHRPVGTVTEEGKDRLKFERCEGVFFLLDEVQNFFNARRWTETGHHVLFYVSQHRKLGDDVWLCTQHPNNIDKQFRSVAQDYVYLRNLSNEKRGPFRLPKQFVWSQYLEPKTGPMVKATASGTFRLDVSGLGSCYYTAAGVGVPGTGEADTKKRDKGVSWLWLVLLAVGVLGGFVVLANGGAEKLLPMMFGSGPKPVPSVPGPPVQVEQPAVRPASAPVQVPAVEPASKALPPKPEEKPEAFLTGYVSRGQAVVLMFEDGSEIPVLRECVLVQGNGLAVVERGVLTAYRFRPNIIAKTQ